MRALQYPAVTAQLPASVHTMASDAGQNAALAQRISQNLATVAFVRMKFDRMLLERDRAKRLDEHFAVYVVSRRVQNCQW